MAESIPPSTAALLCIALVVVGASWYDNTEIDTQTQSYCKKNKEDDKTQRPLETSGSSSMFDTFGEVHIGCLSVGFDILSLMLGLLNHGTLNLNLLCEILE